MTDVFDSKLSYPILYYLNNNWFGLTNNNININSYFFREKNKKN